MDGQAAQKQQKNLETLTPKQIVKELDTYIIGQAKAKRAVAIALRNRTRRLKLDEEIREEIAPKNILMIGPTGVGKTEIARRLAKLCGAPFLKVEATKYTEVGYVGRDVESMIRDLMACGFMMVKTEMQEQMKEAATAKVEEDLLDLLLPGSSSRNGKRPAKNSRNKPTAGAAESGKPDSPFKLPDFSSLLNSMPGISGATITIQPQGSAPLSVSSGADDGDHGTAEDDAIAGSTGSIAADTAYDTASGQNAADLSATREKFRSMLRDGKLEDREVEVSVSKQQKMPSMEMFVGGGNMDDIEATMQGITAMLSGGGHPRRKTVTVAEARQLLLSEHLDRMTDPDKVADEAKKRVEQMGIVFIDEIDKIAVSGTRGSGQDVSREGVQRDILPIVEGSSVNTKYGVVDTTHILFIASGAFNLSKPSDLIPELQGRFPLRVELDSLNAEDFKRILLEPKNALTRQYRELLATEGVTITFTDEAVTRMSQLAAEVNSRMENIGARRLHTIMETLLEELSFDADEHAGEKIEITAAYVDERLKDVVQDQDLSKYIL